MTAAAARRRSTGFVVGVVSDTGRVRGSAGVLHFSDIPPGIGLATVEIFDRLRSVHLRSLGDRVT
jgi:hypothetical protein